MPNVHTSTYSQSFTSCLYFCIYLCLSAGQIQADSSATPVCDQTRHKMNGSSRCRPLRFLTASPVSVSVHMDFVCTLLSPAHNKPSHVASHFAALGSLHVHQTTQDPTCFCDARVCQGHDNSTSQPPFDIVRFELCP